MNSIIIFTDGAVPNNQKGGNRKGGVGVFFGDNDVRNISYSIKETLTFKVTNNICELLACINGIETCVPSNNIIIMTDSMYIVNSMTVWGKKWEKNDWKKSKHTKIENEDLIKKLYYLTNNFNIKYKHVKAHTKAPSIDSDKYSEWYGNYMADKLAATAATCTPNVNP